MGQSRWRASFYSSPNLQFLVCKVLSQLFGYSFQVLERDLARLVVIKQPEGFQDLLFGVLLGLKSGRRTSTVTYCTLGSESRHGTETKTKNI